MLAQPPHAYANHETINLELRPSESGSYYAGDKIGVILHLASGPVPLGHNTVEANGEVQYDVVYRLQLIDPADTLVRKHSQGLTGTPDIKKTNVFEFPEPLTLGKWRVSVDVYEMDSREPLLGETWTRDFDVVSRPSMDPLATAGLIVAAIAGIGLPAYAYFRPKKEKNTASASPVAQQKVVDKQAILQQIINLIEEVPKENMANLQYHYCKLKNNGRMADFSYHPKPGLRNQADKVELTLERVAGILLDTPEVYNEFFGLYSDYLLLAWVLCKEDIDAKRSVNPHSGKKFQELAKKISNEVKSIPKPDCTKVTEWMPPPDAEVKKAARELMKRIGKEKVSILLQEAKLLALDTRDQKMLDWIEIELAGYYPDADKMSPEENRRTAHNIPDYRLVKGFFHFQIDDGSIHDLPYSVKMGNSIKTFENLVDQLLPTGGNGYVPYTFPADTPIVAGQKGKMEVNVSQFQRVVSGVETELSRRLQEMIS